MPSAFNPSAMARSVAASAFLQRFDRRCDIGSPHRRAAAVNAPQGNLTAGAFFGLGATSSQRD
jgi:hypothetical protein